MPEFRRYAIYFTPYDGPLAWFGAEWLGWDIRSGREMPHPDLPGLPRERIASLTDTPRRYGFHATLKPPFRLAEGQTVADLLQELRSLCRLRSRIILASGLRVAALDGFVALIPAQPSFELRRLAAALVRGLDSFRAPLTEAEIARRRPERLTPQQLSNLEEWGYPWVMEEFRFHMTLTGKLPPDELEDVLARLDNMSRLTPRLIPALPDPMVISAITLCGEDEQGRFHVIAQARLGA